MASADLKLLTPEDAVPQSGAQDRGYRLLEINDGNQSGFTDYFMAQNIFPQYRHDLFKGFKIYAGMNMLQRMTATKKARIWFPRDDKTIHSFSRSQIISNNILTEKSDFNLHDERLIIVNNNLPFLAVCHNKAVQYYIAEKTPSLKNLFPQTAVISTDPDYFKIASHKFLESDHVMFKPVNCVGGTGVRLVKTKSLHKNIKKIFSSWARRNASFEGQNEWNAPVALLQEKIKPNLVPWENKNYDGTMRAVFTAYKLDKDAEWKCHVHGVYWKLARNPYTGAGHVDEVVSLSPSYKKESDLVVMGKMLVHNARPYTDDDFKAVPVDKAVQEWLVPQLERDMGAFTTAITASSVYKTVQDIASSQHLCASEMAAMYMLGDDDYFPETPQPDGSYVIRFSLPDEMFALAETLKNKCAPEHGLVDYIDSKISGHRIRSLVEKHHRMKLKMGIDFENC